MGCYSGCSPDPGNCPGGMAWECTRCVQDISPVVIDLDGDGFDFTNAANGVDFDINGNGTLDEISWTAAGSDDAWLALDRDKNGKIDNGRELFGNFTNQPSTRVRNGFLALAVFDTQQYGGNGDLRITDQDAIFGSLQLWQDTNHNGISEADELQNLAVSPIREIDLIHLLSLRTDEHGNRFKYRARVRDERGAQAGRWAWDVYLLKETP